MDELPVSRGSVELNGIFVKLADVGPIFSKNDVPVSKIERATNLRIQRNLERAAASSSQWAGLLYFTGVNTLMTRDVKEKKTLAAKSVPHLWSIIFLK